MCSGPTGVGKSLASALIAKALFSDRHKQTGVLCGLLHKKMRPYETHGDQTSPAQLTQMMDEVEGDIARQLLECPR